MFKGKIKKNCSLPCHPGILPDFTDIFFPLLWQTVPLFFYFFDAANTATHPLRTHYVPSTHIMPMSRALPKNGVLPFSRDCYKVLRRTSYKMIFQHNNSLKWWFKAELKTYFFPTGLPIELVGCMYIIVVFTCSVRECKFVNAE